ncbi:MAG: sialidase family protein [Actinomycetota bacterium]
MRVRSTIALLAVSALLLGLVAHRPARVAHTGAASTTRNSAWGLLQHNLALDMEEPANLHFVHGVTPKNQRKSPVAAAGPVAVVHRAGGQVVSSSSAGSSPSARLYRTGFEAGEPMIGVTKDGSIFFQALAGSPKVVRGTRQGNGDFKWEDVSPMIGNRQRHPESLDPYLYVDQRTDRVFTLDFLFGCSELSFTDDLGKSWTTSPLQCAEQDHQNLFTGPPPKGGTAPVGYPDVVYACSSQAGATIYSVAAQCEKSLDGGVSYVGTGEPVFVTNQQDENDLGVEGYCHGAIGHGFVGPDGTVYIPKGFCGQPWLAISHDEGATWTRVQVAKNGVPLSPTGVFEHEAAVVADTKGNVYYFWMSRDRLPYLAVSRNGGTKWGKPMMIGAPGIKEATLPSLTIGADGKIAAVYYGSTNSPGKPFPESKDCKPDPAKCFKALFFLNPPDPKRYEDVTWNGYMTVTADALAKHPKFYSASINDPSDPFVRGTCGPIRCKAVYDFIDVVIDRQGRPWASYVDACVTTCVTKGPNDVGDEGVVGTLVGGPSLR